jgi:hypothetical protein
MSYIGKVTPAPKSKLGKGKMMKLSFGIYWSEARWKSDVESNFEEIKTPVSG